MKEKWIKRWTKFKKVSRKVLFFIFVKPFIEGFIFAKEFIYLRVDIKGKIIYKPSSTKAIATAFTLLCIVVIMLVIRAFKLKLIGTDTQRAELTPDVLQTYLGLAGIVTILAGFLRFLYTHQKKKDVEKIIEANGVENIKIKKQKKEVLYEDRLDLDDEENEGSEGSEETDNEVKSD